MVNLFCKKCGYKFENKQGYNLKRCPYCNNESLEEEHGAQELLDEVDKMLE